MNHIRLIIALTLPVLLIFTGVAGISNQQVKAQSAGDVGKYLQGLTKNICKDNPLSSQGIPTITIPGNVSGKNGGVTAYGNANSENGKNGPISIGGGGDNGKDNGISSVGGGNGGIALCGSANGK
jgi:hypothetical protein